MLHAFILAFSCGALAFKEGDEGVVGVLDVLGEEDNEEVLNEEDNAEDEEEVVGVLDVLGEEDSEDVLDKEEGVADEEESEANS